MKIKIYNNIAAVGTDQFDEKKYEIGTEVENPDGILVRSAKLHDMPINPELKAIARAGTGVDNIPIPRCTENGVVVFNTVGANANGVKEMVLCSLVLASRDVIGGEKWASSLEGDVPALVEKGKKAFAGTEIKGKTLCIIGLGSVGGMVANMAVHLGMEVIGYDPYLSVENAWNLNHHVNHAHSYDEIFRKADYLTVHVPLTEQTKGLIGGENLKKMKQGAHVLNFSRAELVDSEDMKAALANGQVKCYVTDFPTQEMQNVPGVVMLPHLGGSTMESEDNCAELAARELIDYLENGNIRNSVNFPPVSMPRSGENRICIFNANVPEVISNVSKLLSAEGANIENMTNKSRGDYAYTMIDVSGCHCAGLQEKLLSIPGVTKVRVL